MTLIGAASMAAALLVVGCGDNDAKPVSSKAGESCVRTADCADGLSCIANVCYSTAPSSGGDSGSGGGPVVGPVLGGEGESCTSRQDCKDGLACFNQRCTQSTSPGAGGDDGGGTPTAQLGERGETCRVNADCSTDLVCVPSGTFGVGVCDVKNFGVTPTGKTCSGECSTSDDCCQLPLAAHTTEVKSCDDIDALITAEAIKCTAPSAGRNAQLCFYQSAYCSKCTSKTWACTHNTCVYAAACAVTTMEAPTGCPIYSRLGSPNLPCNTSAKKCTGTATVTTPDCSSDADCDDHGVVFDDPSTTAIDKDPCAAGECTCYLANHECYRKCDRDIDCADSKVCDKDRNLCVPSAACQTNAQCQISRGSIDYACDPGTGTCKLSCTADRDCSSTGSIATDTFFSGRVCVSGFCETAGGCTTDAECPGVEGQLKKFCVEPVVDTTVPVYSAVTD